MTESADIAPRSQALFISGYNKRLLLSLFIANVAIFQVYAAFTGILLPAMVEAINPAQKVVNLALVSGISAAFATVMNPLGGAWSDRTHSRWGQRTPWLIGAALATCVSSIFLGLQTTVVGILVAWCLVQGIGNIYNAAITAVVPDRVPPEKRGTAVGASGMGPTIGTMTGIAIAGYFVQEPWIAGLITGLSLVLAAFLFLFLSPEAANHLPEETGLAAPRQPFWHFFSSLASRNFRLIFISRLLLMVGFFAVQGYYYYLLQDYIHIGRYGMSPETGILIMTLISSTASLIALVVGGLLSDRTGRRKGFVVGATFFTALIMLIPWIWPTWSAFLVFVALLGAGFGLYMTVSNAVATLVLPNAADNARDMGIFNIANAGPLILAPLLSAAIISSLGGYPALFICSAILMTLGGLVVLQIRNVR
jgi:MFS family permease